EPQGRGGALGGDPRAAYRAHRTCRHAGGVVHSRRSHLQRARDLAHLRHPRFDAANAGRHTAVVLRRLSAAPSSTHRREFIMTSWQITRVFAGCFILISLALGVPASPLFVSEYWLLFTAFVGLNLMQSGFS